MQTLIIDQKGSRLSHERHRLIVHHDGLPKPISIPFEQLNEVIISSLVDIKSSLLNQLSKYQINLTVLPASRHGAPCRLLGGWQGDVIRRVRQYHAFENDDISLIWAKHIIQIKLYRHASLLYRLYQYQPNARTDAAISTLRQGRANVQIAASQDSIRGIEGGMAGVFFAAYQHHFDKQWRFHHRNRRPPADPINVLLSLGYHMIQSLCEQVIYAAGLDPYLGVLHRPNYNRPSLACDIAEVFRADIEWWVWQMVTDGLLTSQDFGQGGDDRPCELLKSGRRVFYTQWAILRPNLQKRCQKTVYVLHDRLCQSGGQSKASVTQLSYLSQFNASQGE